MLKATKDYALYIFDLDGTLYDQPKLRFGMGKRLVSYYIAHPFRIGELFTLMRFRKLKDEWNEIVTCKQSDNKGIALVDVAICNKMSETVGKPADEIIGIVKKWIYDAPLSELIKARDSRLCECIDRLRANGKKVVILSDYPTNDKLQALNVTVDGEYSGSDERIGQLKPSPKGIEVILEDLQIAKSEAYLIGDRMEKDGQCAIAGGIDYLILPRDIKKRNTFYE